MKRIIESNLPMPRASLPEGCVDLIDAYRLRAASKEERSNLLLRIAATLHDPFIAQLDPEILCTQDSYLLAQRISDFLHPILLANPELEKQVRPTSDLVDLFLHVVFSIYDDERDKNSN